MPRVAVIIPAYNAADTLEETLTSASAQTFRDLEIIVVSDGSTDATAAVVERVRHKDSRIRLIEQTNAGVAAARNAGIVASDSDFVAPLDADDLWHPDKLALQLARFDACPPKTGLVYNWYHPIDRRSHIVGPVATPVIEGFVLHRHLTWNFVGNGSTPLFRRDALTGLAYDAGLAARNAGGCEDYLLQLQIAKNWHFACVPAHLTGYRQGPGRMSGQTLTMLRSYQATFNKMRGEVGDAGRMLCDRGFAQAKVLEASHLAGRKEYRGAAAAYAAAMLNAPAKTASATHRQVRILRKVRARAAVEADISVTPFVEANPFRRALPWSPNAEMRWAASFDIQSR